MFNSTNRLKKQLLWAGLVIRKIGFQIYPNRAKKLCSRPISCKTKFNRGVSYVTLANGSCIPLGVGWGGGVTSFPALCIFASATSSATCFPAFGTGCVFSHAGFLSFTPLTYFPAIGAVNVFWYVCNGLAFTRRHNQSLDFASTLISLYVYGRRVF